MLLVQKNENLNLMKGKIFLKCLDQLVMTNSRKAILSLIHLEKNKRKNITRTLVLGHMMQTQIILKIQAGPM